MSGFKVSQKKDDNMKLRLQFEGAMDEHSDYTQINMADMNNEVVFDFENVSHINSTGIKYWVKWIDSVTKEHPRMSFWFINTPKAIVDQINMVEGFLPPNSTVQSFKVPYYCEACESDKMQIFVLGREYEKSDSGFELKMPDYTCDRDDCEMEPDVVEQKYFRFLVKK